MVVLTTKFYLSTSDTAFLSISVVAGVLNEHRTISIKDASKINPDFFIFEWVCVEQK